MTIVDTIASELEKPLDSSRVKTREGTFGKPLAYIETHDAIRTANRIFGFGGWGHHVADLTCIGSVPVKGKDGKDGVHVGYRCTVILKVDGCIPTSGVGYGDATEYRQTALVTAHELACKEAESDGLKRALKNYGDQFGLALYDKDVASTGHVTKTAAPPHRAVGGQPGLEPSSGGDNPAPGPAAPSFAPPPSVGAQPEFVFPSGKYVGKALSEVPESYLTWYAGSGPRPDVKAAIALFFGVVNGPSTKDLGDEDLPF